MCGNSHFTNILFEAHMKRKPSYSRVKHTCAKSQDLTPNLAETNSSRTERRYLALRRRGFLTVGIASASRYAGPTAK